MAISQIQTNSMAANSVTTLVLANGAVSSNNFSSSANNAITGKSIAMSIVFGG